MGGCAGLSPSQPNEPVKVANHYRVTPQIEWNRVRLEQFELWTVDGPQLEQLRFYRAIEGGENLQPSIRQGGRKQSDLPQYHGWMRAHDVLELVIATLMQSGATGARAQGPEPASFGDRIGFRFELTFTSSEGLGYRGLARGLIDDERRLHLVLYLGARPHYFDAYQGEVERLFNSIELL